MTWVATAIVASSVIGGSMQSSAAKSAANTQAESTRYAADIQKQMFDIQNEQLKPYREAGYGALTRIQDLLPSLTAPVTEAEIRGLPGFDFAMKQGLGATRQQFNVGGGGSNVDRAAQKFATDYVVSTAMPQVIAQRQNIYNTLAGIAGIGQTAQNTSTALGQATAGNIGNLAVGGANAAAAGQIGSANAWSSALGNLPGAAMMYKMYSPTAATNYAPVYDAVPVSVG